MSHGRTMKNRIKKIHEEALRLTYKNEISILQIVVAEIYQVRNDLGPEVMKDIFHFVKKPYNFKNIFSFSKNMGINTCKIKHAKSLGNFKEKIRLWKTDKCPCPWYIDNVGFV